MIKFGSSIGLRRKNAIIYNPKLFCFWIDVNTSYDPNSSNNPFGIATKLSAYHFDRSRIIFVKYGIIKDDNAIRRQD
ncbi:MAG TPA: hypothetical protein DIW24_04055 [Bacteroidetes bacterium]|nr:hypothetical protein [Bacteroidota bacterium]